MGFGISSDDDAERGVVVGVNFSPALRCPLRDLDDLLGEHRIDSFDPVTGFVHLTCPLLEFTDRRKAHLIGYALADVVRLVAKYWKRAKRQADREERLHEAQLAAERGRSRPLTFKAAAFEGMPAAYASS